MSRLGPLFVAAVSLLAATLAGAEPFEEASFTTQHEIRLNSVTLTYSAETGRIAIRDAETGQPHGQMFYTAYRVASDRPRPIAFVWNGGPGANSALLHFEAAGPRRLDDDDLVDNADTWLTDMDLVFVDPIGTGFSRPVKAEYADAFYGTIGDVASVTEFVRAWRLVHAAEASPVVLIGESWGAGRAGSVGYNLEQLGIGVRALVLISGGTGISDNPVPVALRRALWVADLSMTARYHGLLGSDLDGPATEIRKEAEAWARDVYAPALERVDVLDERQIVAVIDGLSRYTGMPADTIDRTSLVMRPRAYRENLLPDGDHNVQVFDMRLVTPKSDPSSGAGESDRAAVITRYLRHELGFATSLSYVGLERWDEGFAPDGRHPESVGARWNYATAELSQEEIDAAIREAVRHGGGPPRLGPPLPSAAEAVAQNPNIKVWVAAGRYDSLNSCTANDELARRLDEPLQSAYTFACYEGGHMMYRDPEVRSELSRHIRSVAASAN